MQWQQASATWPTNASDLSARAVAEIAPITGRNNAAAQRLDDLREQVSYQPQQNNSAAMFSELQQLAANGQVVIAAPGMHVRQSAELGLTARNAINLVADKCADLADKRRAAVSRGIIWLFSQPTDRELATDLTALCEWLNLPELSAAYRRMNAVVNLPKSQLVKPAVPKAGHFSAEKVLMPAPLSDWFNNTNALISQLDSVNSSETPIDKLVTLAEKRNQWLNTLQQKDEAFNRIVSGGRCWCLNIEGGLAEITRTLREELPVNHQFSVAIAFLFKHNAGAMGGVFNVPVST